MEDGGREEILFQPKEFFVQEFITVKFVMLTVLFYFIILFLSIFYCTFQLSCIHDFHCFNLNPDTLK